MIKSKIVFIPIGIALIGIISYFLFFDAPSDKQVVQSLEALLPRLESAGLTAYRNQNWCQVVAYNGKAFSNTNESNCTFVTDLTTSPFSAESNTKMKEIADILSSSKIKIRSLEKIQIREGKITFVEFYKDCECSTRYVFNPGYGNLPTDIPNQLWHFRIDQNWYRVEEDWN